MTSIILGTVLIFLQLMGDMGNLKTEGLGFYNLMSFLGYSLVGIAGVICLIVGIIGRYKQPKDSNSVEESSISQDDEYKEYPIKEKDIVSTKEDSVSDDIASLNKKAETVNKESLVRFCCKCGKPINPETKKCTGCGKQYFKGLKFYFKTIFTKKRILPIALSVILIISLISNIIQAIDIKDYQDIVRDQHETIDEKTDLLYTFVEIGAEQYQLLKFYEENVVIIPTNGSNLYHKYGCEDLDTPSLIIYTITQARQLNYAPCKKCYD